MLREWSEFSLTVLSTGSARDILKSKIVFSYLVTMHQILKTNERISFLTISVEREKKYLPSKN